VFTTGHLYRKSKNIILHYSSYTKIMLCKNYLRDRLYNKWVEEIEDATKERPRSFDEANAMIRSWPYDQSKQSIAIGIFYIEQRSTFEEEVLKWQVPESDKIEGIEKILERMR